MTERAHVPCNGCRECCRNDRIFLHEDEGDDHAAYQTEIGFNPVSAKMQPMLAHKPNGECVYLGSSGCTIWNRAPVICRTFDCRELFQRLTRDERRRLVKLNVITKKIFAEGRARLSTLSEAASDETVTERAS